MQLVGQQAARWTAPDLRLVRSCTRGRRVRVRLIGRDTELVRDVRFEIGQRLAARDTAAPFTKTLRRRAGARSVRAVAVLQAGPLRVIARRSLPRC